MEELYIIRHGYAEHLNKGTTGGWTDSHLTEIGMEQAINTGQQLRSLLRNKNYQLFCSDLSRARKTAEIIGSIIECKPREMFDLRELNNGVAANKTREEAKSLEIPITKPILDWRPYPEAESWHMLHTRVTKCMEEIDRETKSTAIVVTHANTANSIIQWWLEFTPEIIEKISFEIEPCSITHLTITRWSNSKTINKLNDTGHL